jgi:hypothetical protein
MAKQEPMNAYPHRIMHELMELHELYNVAPEDPLAILTAALRCHGFAIDQIGDLREDKPWQRSRGYGPYLWLWSHDGKERLEESWGVDDGVDRESEEHAALRDKMAIANLRDRARLLDLLGEFYSRRFAPIYVRLIVSDLAVGSSLLKSQGSDVMALPENQSHQEKWLNQSRTEMTDFAAFLIAKLEEKS